MKSRHDARLSRLIHLLRATELVQAGLPRDQLVEELCLAVLGRKPQDKERQIASRLFAGASRQQAAEDFLWTLLNSYEFLFIH